MNVFNRIVMIVAVLLFIALAAYVMIAPSDASYFAQQGISYLEENVADAWFYQWFLIGGGVLLLVLLIVFYLEVRRGKRKAVRIKTQGGGYARLEIGSVAESLEYRVDELAGVRKVKTRITSRGKDVEVALDLDTSPSVNIPVLTDQIIALCHDIVEGQLGIQIHGRPIINIKHEPYPRGTMPSTKPLGSEPIVATPPVSNHAKPQPQSYGGSLGLGELSSTDAEPTAAQRADDELVDDVLAQDKKARKG